MVTAGASGNRFRSPQIASRRVNMARHQPLAWLTLAASIFVSMSTLALEKTLPGEPPADVGRPLDEPLASGRVVAVDRDAGRITLEYRPIPELFLEGGTRIFRVEDPKSLKGLGPGDKVRFEVE